jgi:hypothetical protein
MRATRFTLNFPVEYRPLGEPMWHAGRTVNMSRTGVLFRAEGPLDVDTPIEMRVYLQAQTGKLLSELFCRARVVRQAPGATEPRLAASFQEVEFIKRS